MKNDEKEQFVVDENTGFFGGSRRTEEKKTMKKRKTYEETMLEKYPNLYKIGNCHNCGADLRYLERIHRINYEWYCNKCWNNRK